MRNFLLLILPINLFAQSPQVLSVFPANMAGAALPSQSIVIQYDAPIDPGSVSTASVRVFGRWSGPAAGSFTTEDSDKRIVFSPDQPFFAGEQVTVSINKKLRSDSGMPLDKGYFWQYSIKVAPGSLSFYEVDTIPLRLPTEISIGISGIYAGDLNNDGHSDLTAITFEPDDLRILLNDDTGQFPVISPPILIGTNTAGHNELAGDFNNDGEIDLVVITGYNETSVLFGDGMGGFSHIDKYITGSGTYGVLVGDFDFDGDDDILTTYKADGTMNRLENQGNGLFTISTFNPLGNPFGDVEEALVLADANNDGMADFFAGYDSRKIALYMGDGLGNFNFSSSTDIIGNNLVESAAMCTADFNGDGFADVASAASGGDITAVIFGDGQGGVSTPVNLVIENGIYPLDVDAGDLDGDDDIDLVVTYYDGAHFAVFENGGVGNFTNIGVLNANWAECAVLHDRDGDGDLDITGAKGQEDKLILYENSDASATREPEDKVVHFKVFPNPAKGAVFAEIELQAPTTARFDIYDFSGKKIKSVQTDVMPSGLSKILIMNDIKDVPKAYQVQVVLANGQTGAAVLIRG